MGDGDCTHSQTEQLSQSARFVFGRHQEHIRAHVNLISQVDVEFNVGGYLVRVFLSQVSCHLFVFGLSSSQDNHLQILHEYQVRNLGKDVQPFLGYQPCDNTN